MLRAKSMHAMHPNQFDWQTHTRTDAHIESAYDSRLLNCFEGNIGHKYILLSVLNVILATSRDSYFAFITRVSCIVLIQTSVPAVEAKCKPELGR